MAMVVDIQSGTRGRKDNTESTARENRGGFIELGNCNKFRRIDHPL